MLIYQKDIKPVRVHWDDIIEVECEFIPYDETIDYIKTVNNVYNNLKTISLLISQKHNLYKSTELTRGLLRLTEQHKTIYETHTNIDKAFKDQAGPYESVVDAYNKYKEKYDLEYAKPIESITMVIACLHQCNYIHLTNASLIMETILSICSDKQKFKIYN